MAHLITDADYLLLTAVTTGGVVFTVIFLDDKGIRICDLDKVVRVLLRCNSLMQVSTIRRTKMVITYAKHALHVS